VTALAGLAALALGAFVFLAVGVLAGAGVGRGTQRVPSARPETPSRLAAAIAPVPVSRFVAVSAAAGVLAFLVAAVVTGAPLVAVVPGVVVAGAPGAWYAHRRQARVRAVRAAWPDGLRDIAASVGSGRSVAQALEAMSVSGPLPLRDAFTGFGGFARAFGVSVALRRVAADLADATTDRVVEVLVLAHERGGRIVSEILDDLVVGTTRDLEVLAQIESEGLESRINAGAVVVLPWSVLLVLTAKGGAFRGFYTSPAGFVVVLVGALLSATGYLWIRHLGRGHDEPRVLAAADGALP
jgi:tight adherence protein B